MAPPPTEQRRGEGEGERGRRKGAVRRGSREKEKGSRREGRGGGVQGQEGELWGEELGRTSRSGPFSSLSPLEAEGLEGLQTPGPRSRQPPRRPLRRRDVETSPQDPLSTCLSREPHLSQTTISLAVVLSESCGPRAQLSCTKWAGLSCQEAASSHRALSKAQAGSGDSMPPASVPRKVIPG